jgi:tetratricopeptide (TPR) repeat protein
MTADARAAEQTATATGVCGVAINASGQATVVVNNYCDAKTAATVKLLLDKAEAQGKLDSQQSQRIGKLQRDGDTFVRQLQDLSAAVQSVQRLTSAVQATPADKQAQELLVQGDTSGAVAVLGREAGALQARSLAEGTAAAELYRQQAALLRLSSAEQALRAIERSLALRPDNFQAQWDAGELYAAAGTLSKAGECYAHMLAIAVDRSTAEPVSSEWRRNVSISHLKIGDAHRAQGQLSQALQSYRTALEISETLAAADPSNVQWKVDLALRHDRIGVTQREQGDITSATQSFRAATVIRQDLTSVDPGNREWLRDFGVRYDRAGNSPEMTLAAALQEVRAMVSQALLASDKPTDAQAQRDLSTSWDTLGTSALARGDLASALSSFQAAFVIRQRLVDSDGSNRQLKSEISFSHDQIGETLARQGNTMAALQSFQTAMSLRQELAAADPTNAQWQTDLATSAWKIGSMKMSSLNNAERKAVLNQGLRALDRLALRGSLTPTYAGWPSMFRQAIAELP